MDYIAKITGLEVEKAQLKAELDNVKTELLRAVDGSDKQKYLQDKEHDLNQRITAIDNQITEFAKLLRPPAVARSEALSGDNSESVASTSHYVGLNQFQVHIPSEYDTELPTLNLILVECVERASKHGGRRVEENLVCR